jgi:hypothetical protein
MNAAASTSRLRDSGDERSRLIHGARAADRAAGATRSIPAGSTCRERATKSELAPCFNRQFGWTTAAGTESRRGNCRGAAAILEMASSIASRGRRQDDLAETPCQATATASSPACSLRAVLRFQIGANRGPIAARRLATQGAVGASLDRGRPCPLRVCVWLAVDAGDELGDNRRPLLERQAERLFDDLASGVAHERRIARRVSRCTGASPARVSGRRRSSRLGSAGRR